MTIALKDRSALVRAIAWVALQAVFFLWVHPVGRWARRDTKVYFCFAAFALASLSIAAVLPILSRVSLRVKILVAGMFALAAWELIAATRVLFYQF